MNYLDAVGDLGFVVAAYGVILGGIGLYAVSLARRLRRARHATPAPAPEPSRPSKPPADYPA